MMRPAIEFRNVTKHYALCPELKGGIKNFLFRLPGALDQLRHSRHCALEDVSFTVKPGESLGIIGRNGAGKSTLLGLMAGVLRPSSGSVTVNGRVAPLLELGGGFHPDLTGTDNVLLSGVLLGLSRAEAAGRLEEITRFAGLGRHIAQPVRTYSGGMLARLGFSVAAHLDPDIILIDEVLAVGDADFSRKCLNKMHAFKRAGVTIILVSHSMGSVRDICDRAIWVEDRRIRLDGDAGTVTSGYLDAARER